MELLKLIKSKAVDKKLLAPAEEIDAATAFYLVRDMPYKRASSREPSTTINEWRGTCSGKHILLKALFAELGIESDLIACTTEDYINPKETFGKLRKILEQTDGRVIDIHNYLVLKLPSGDMLVDATCPLSMKELGIQVNEEFILGKDQVPASEPIKPWTVPDDHDPEVFKEKLLRENFTREELEHREEFITTFSKMINSKWVNLLIKFRAGLK